MPLYLTSAIFARGDADEEEDGVGDEIVRPRRQASQRSEDPLRDPQHFRACTCLLPRKLARPAVSAR